MKAQFHGESGSGLDTRVRKQADNDDVGDAMLPELLSEISVSETALSPVLLDDNITLLGCKIRMPISAPLAASERVPFHDSELSWIGMAPALVVAWLPTPVRNDEDPHACTAHGPIDTLQVVDEADFLGDGFDARPYFAILGQEIVIWINE
jgi:hypothetical protein